MPHNIHVHIAGIDLIRGAKGEFYVLEDNLDLDEDQNQSISTDDDDFEELNER